MPQQPPISSTTGIRRTRFTSIVLQHSSRLVSGMTMTLGLDMHSPAIISSGFLPRATVRQVMSRSVITPTGFIVFSLSTTGISPQSVVPPPCGTRSNTIFTRSGRVSSCLGFSDVALSCPSLCWSRFSFFRNVRSGLGFKTITLNMHWL